MIVDPWGLKAGPVAVGPRVWAGEGVKSKRAKTSTFGASRGATEKRNCLSGPRRKRNQREGSQSKTGTTTGAVGRGPDIFKELRGGLPAARHVKKLSPPGGERKGDDEFPDTRGAEAIRDT